MDNGRAAKRLGIFAFYDAFGIVDSYVEKLLDSTIAEVKKLIIVVNGNIIEDSRQKLSNYTTNIYIRENIGFDAGAYKDAFLHFLVEEDWNKWDEVLLFNDTFYGPVFPWKLIFEKMEKEKDLDFWGLTKHPGLCGMKSKYPEHIQSYFLVFRKKLFLSPAFWSFWERLEYPQSRLMATENFEVKLTSYFGEQGFKYETYMDVCDCKIPFDYIGSIYYAKPYELLSVLKIPIIKRKALVINNFIEAQQALDYIKRFTNYNVNIIYNHLRRLSIENRVTPFNPIQLERFYDTHKKIYIYGYGKYGKNIATYFSYRKWKYEGFFVSDKVDNMPNVYSYHDISLTCDEGVILALGTKAFREVYPKVVQSLDFRQLFLPF